MPLENIENNTELVILVKEYLYEYRPELDEDVCWFGTGCDGFSEAENNPI